MKKVILLLSSILLASGCSANQSTSSESKLGIKGRFVNETELKVLHRKDVVDEPGFVYTSTYPLNQISGFGCYESHEPGQEFRYYYYQNLTLSKDGTYHYVYDVIFGNPWNAPDLMAISVDVSGVILDIFQSAEKEYYVSLSAPREGTESIYGCFFEVKDLWWFGGGAASKHSQPDREIDFARLKEIKKEEVDWYVRSRTVKVSYSSKKDEPNKVEDDLFNAYFLDDVGQYCTY